MVRREQCHNSIYLLFIFILSACGKGRDDKTKFRQINEQKVEVRFSGGTIYVKDTVFFGLLYRLNKGDTVSVKTYRNGKEHGVWKQYYPNRQLREIRYFVHGKKQGEYLTWWPNGQKKSEYHFVNDQYEGNCREWNANGILVREMNYKNGHEQGSQKVWYDNGSIKSNYVIKNGRCYGLLGTKNCVNATDPIFNK